MLIVKFASIPWLAIGGNVTKALNSKIFLGKVVVSGFGFVGGDWLPWWKQAFKVLVAKPLISPSPS